MESFSRHRMLRIQIFNLTLQNLFYFYRSDRFYFTQIQNRIQVVSIQKRNSCGLSCKKCCSHLQNPKRAYIIVVAVRHRLTAF